MLMFLKIYFLISIIVIFFLTKYIYDERKKYKRLEKRFWKLQDFIENYDNISSKVLEETYCKICSSECENQDKCQKCVDFINEYRNNLKIMRTQKWAKIIEKTQEIYKKS